MTRYVVVMDDMKVRYENMDESEIPGLLDSGFACAVLNILSTEIRYAVVDWDKYAVKEWKLPELEVRE